MENGSFFRNNLNKNIDEFNNKSTFLFIKYKIIDIDAVITSYRDIILEIYLKENNEIFNIDTDYKKLDDEVFFFEFLKLIQIFCEYFMFRKKSDEEKILKEIENKKNNKEEIKDTQNSIKRLSLKEATYQNILSKFEKRESLKNQKIENEEVDKKKENELMSEYFQSLDETFIDNIYIIDFIEKIKKSKTFKFLNNELVETFNKNKKYIRLELDENTNEVLFTLKEDFYIDIKYRNTFKDENKNLLKLKLNILKGKEDLLNDYLFGPESLYDNIISYRHIVLKLYGEVSNIIGYFDIESKNFIEETKYLDFFYGIKSIEKVIKGIEDFYINDLEEIKKNIKGVLRKLINRLS